MFFQLILHDLYYLGFRLTIRNVNKATASFVTIFVASFRLTISNVNNDMTVNMRVLPDRFRLTIRNVNNLSAWSFVDSNHVLD